MSSLPYSPAELRQLNLQQQGLLSRGRGKAAVLQSIQQLGYLQIDAINVVERAHHHILHSRVSQYQPLWLDQLLAEKQIFEYWSHAAAYLPMTDFRFSLFRKQELVAGKKHWFAPDHAQMNEIRARIKAEGPCKAADFISQQKRQGTWWDWQPAKQALEQLFMQGELMVLRRDKFQKVFDLTERVLPAHIDTSVPTAAEYARYLIQRYLQSHGFGSAAQISYLRPGIKAEVQQQLQALQEDAVLQSFQWQNQRYYLDPKLELSKKPAKKTLRLLNPFDNVLIQRQRLQHWFEFDYQIEVYVPAAKRVVGYYNLVLLYGEKMVGQLDVKAERQSGTLLLQHLLIENQPLTAAFGRALWHELMAYASFNGCQQVRLIKASAAVRKWFLAIQNLPDETRTDL